MRGRFKKLSHVIYYHVFHIVWTPKYRYKVLKDNLKGFTEASIRSLCEWKKAEILERYVKGTCVTKLKGHSLHFSKFVI